MKQVKIVLAALLLFFIAKSSAQINIVSEKSEVIVEGVVKAKKSLWNKDKTQIVTENTVYVKIVFKGAVTSKQITVLTSGGQTEEVLQFQPHAIELALEQKGYFFLIPDDDGKYKFVDNSYGFASQNFDLNPKVFAFGKRHSQKQFEEMIIGATLLPKINIDENREIESYVFFTENASCETIIQSAEEKTIEFLFENTQFSGGFTHVEFDVMAKVNLPGLKFGKGNLLINYSDEFGTSVVSNQTIEITKGTAIENSIYTMSYDDASPQSVSVTIDSDSAIDNYFTFSESPEVLFHVKIAISDFSQIGNISFDSINVAGQVYYWCAGRYEPFDRVVLDDPISHTNPKDAIGITYTFENGATNTDETEFRIDLYAKAAQESFYSDGFIYVNYNESGFGSSVFSAGSFTFELNSVFNTSGVYSTLISDSDQNTLTILIYSEVGANETNLSVLSISPQKLGTLKFKIVDCSQAKGISFDQAQMVSAGTVHYTGNMPIPWEAYSPIVAEDEENGQICGCGGDPVITSFETPHPNNVIHAGTGEILIIHGNNFGNWNSAECTVIFKNGDEGGAPDEIEAGAKDFEWDGVVHWSDDKIEIKVPSTDKNPGIKDPAESGTFKVKNACGTSEPSPEQLSIPYAIFNNRGGIFSTPTKLTLKESDPNGICFHYSENLPSWIRTEFEAALNSWCAETGVSFFIGEPVSINASAVDGVSVISKQQGGSNQLEGNMVVTSTYYNQLCNSGTENGNVFKEIDINITTGVTSPTTDQLAFIRRAIKHELGHAHMLQHTDALTPQASQYLMHPNANTNGIITASDSEGANLLFQNSANIVHGTCGTPITNNGGCGATCDFNSTHNVNPTSDAEIFPNPTSGFVTMRFKTEINRLKVSISNIYGKNIEVYELGASKEYNFQLPENRGVYLLTYEINGQKTFTVKITKI